jgi:hypothetical protein
MFSETTDVRGLREKNPDVVEHGSLLNEGNVQIHFGMSDSQ